MPPKRKASSTLAAVSVPVAALVASSTMPMPLPAAAASSASRKRKLDDKNLQKYYAVRTGARPGIYLTWNECQAQIAGFKGAQFKSFTSREDAAAFVAGKNPEGGGKDKGEPRYYAVAVGTMPGIYTDWETASKAIVGAKGPKYKKFPTRAEAVNFIRMYGNASTRQALSTGGDTSGGGAAGTTAVAGTMVSGSSAGARAGASGSGGGTVGSRKSQVNHAAKDENDDSDEDEDDEDDDNNDDDDDDEEGPDGVLATNGPMVKKAKTSGGADTSTVLNVYTDGSSLGNGQNGASAGVGVFFGHGDKRNISERLKGDQQTNQRAELTAILRALQVVPEAQPVRIFSDSTYAIKCVSEWYRSWAANGWKTRGGDTVMNQDLIKMVRSHIDARDRRGTATLFCWVKGHSSDLGNQAADHLANQGARLRG